MNTMHYPIPLEEHYIRRMRETYRRRTRRVAALTTPEDVRRYQQRVRKALNAAFGRLPAKAELKPKVWRVSECGEYRIEHVTFESRPGMWVTANLYLPANVTEKVSGVVFPCGHYAEGKACPIYASACARLAREGYAALIYDPAGQGERDIYSHVDTGGKLSCKNPCDAHNIIGRQLHAGGTGLGRGGCGTGFGRRIIWRVGRKWTRRSWR